MEFPLENEDKESEEQEYSQYASPDEILLHKEPMEEPMYSVVPSKHIFYVLGAGKDKLLPILPYKELETEIKRMEDIFQEIYNIPLSQIQYDVKKKLSSYVLKFLKRYDALEEQKRYYNSIKNNLQIPAENVHIKCYKQAFINLVKSYIGLTPLKRTRSKNSEITESLYDEILDFSTNENISEVIVIGHSYGGAIINRVALLMHQRLPTPPTNVYFLGFGSIYIPRKRYEPFNVNLINYLSLGDNSLKTNWLHHVVPNFVDLKKAFLDMSLNRWKRYVNRNPEVESLPPIICSFQDNNIEYTEGILRWICLFDNHKPLCIVNGKQRKISAFYWKEHYYVRLMEFILLLNEKNKTFTSDIKDFTQYVLNDYSNNLTSQIGGLKTKRKYKMKRKTMKL